MNDERDLNALFAEFYRERARIHRGIFRSVGEVMIGFWVSMLLAVIELWLALWNLSADHTIIAAALIAGAGLVLVTNIRMARSFHRLRRSWCVMYRYHKNKRET